MPRFAVAPNRFEIAQAKACGAHKRGSSAVVLGSRSDLPTVNALAQMPLVRRVFNPPWYGEFGEPAP